VDDAVGGTSGRGRVRAALRGGGWLVAAGVGGFVVARLLGMTDRRPRLFAAATFTVWLLVPCLVVLVVAAAVRARRLLAVAAALLVVLGVWAAPDLRWWSTAAAAEGPTTVIASTNVGPDHRRVEAMAADVVAIGADVLSVVELTEADRRALRAAGIAERYPFSVEDPRAGAHGSGIYSRYPIRDAGVSEFGGAPMAHAVVELPTGPVTVVAVHTTQPLAGPGLLEGQLAELGAAAHRFGGPVVLAGDFNATRQHQPFRELLEDGFRDAHLETGRGLAATWPVGRRLPPFALIDHVLVSDGLTATSVREVRISGSDHLAVVATIGPTRP
jgi:endonuclease/exonuclease/phosphatase (EEP) superfamily protein YafD